MSNYFLLVDRRSTVAEARLVIMEPRTAKCKIVTSPLPATIGRGPEADVQIGDAWVSRLHCRLEEVDGAVVLRDIGSRHGTQVNGMCVSEAALEPGDEIRIGTTSLRVTMENVELHGEGQPQPSAN